MKKTLLAIIIIFLSFQNIDAQTTKESKNSYGILFMAGLRYDDLRMCAASPAGVKGGSIADIMFIMKHQLNKNNALSFNLPVMRPILFGIAFKMLQFEPELRYEHSKMINEKMDLVTGGGLGISLHYGPDYQSSVKDPGPSFFAMGPLFSLQTGIAFKKEMTAKSLLSLKAFYIPLFAKDRDTGTVLGGTVSYAIYF